MPGDPLEKKEVSSPLAKFCIGVLAGCAAIAIPRLSSFLIANEEASWSFFPTSYITGAIIFSILIGLLVMVMEFKIPRPPKETLFAALAIPGLIAGSLNTAVESKEASRMHQQVSSLSEEVRANNNIPIQTIDTIEVIPIDGASTEPVTSSSGFTFELINSAHAEDNKPRLVKQSNAYQTAVQREKPMYAISIERADSYEQAVEKITHIKSQNQNAVLIKTNEQYEILSSNQILSETEATIEAIKLKKQFGMTPKLLKIK